MCIKRDNGCAQVGDVFRSGGPRTGELHLTAGATVSLSHCLTVSQAARRRVVEVDNPPVG